MTGKDGHIMEAEIRWTIGGMYIEYGRKTFMIVRLEYNVRNKAKQTIVKKNKRIYPPHYRFLFTVSELIKTSSVVACFSNVFNLLTPSSSNVSSLFLSRINCRSAASSVC